MAGRWEGARKRDVEKNSSSCLVAAVYQAPFFGHHPGNTTGRLFLRPPRGKMALIRVNGMILLYSLRVEHTANQPIIHLKLPTNSQPIRDTVPFRLSLATWLPTLGRNPPMPCAVQQRFLLVPRNPVLRRSKISRSAHKNYRS